jgi:RES domain-containing protein
MEFIEVLSAWRIVKDRHAPFAFTGEGARRVNGRWNSAGVAMVYTSEHKSLAILETLVHVPATIPILYKAFRIEFPDELVEHLPFKMLPDDWQIEPPTYSTRRIGSEWIHKSRSAILAVPSAIVPEELNYLLNPAHPEFAKIHIGKPTNFAFDARLLK